MQIVQPCSSRLPRKWPLILDSGWYSSTAPAVQQQVVPLELATPETTKCKLQLYVIASTASVCSPNRLANLQNWRVPNEKRPAK